MTPDAPSDAQPVLLELPTGPVSVIDEGDGPPLLSIHGVPGSVRDFRWLAACVEGPLRFIRYDLPGFAGTPLQTMPETSFAARADFVMRLADALELERFTVVGHSMGGGIAMHVAARYPERIAGVALLCSIGLRPHRALRKLKYIKQLSWALRYMPGLRQLMGPMIQKNFVKSGFSPQLTQAESIQSIHLVSAVDYVSVNEAVASLRAPSFVSWSEDDSFIETAVTEELCAALPDGPRHSFASGGHNIQKHQAVELGEALVAWVLGLAG